MSGCVFCQIVAGDLECSEICDEGGFMALMDIYPWRPGHALVLPRRHARSVTELSEEERSRLFALATRLAGAMRSSALGCDDVHIVLNDGPAANQSIPHVHVHLIPRWRGDLWKLAARLVKQPVSRLFGPAPRADLDRQAAEIRAALDR